MLQRFTGQAKRAIVLAQEEASRLQHSWIGTEHLLLGLIREGKDVAAKALESLDISLEAVRQEVEEITGRGQQAPSGPIPFTPRAKKVLELSLREARQFGYNCIGTESILLALVREGDGVAPQVLVKLGADLDRVRQRVIQLVRGDPAEKPAPGRSAESKLDTRLIVETRLQKLKHRLAVLEQRARTRPDTSDLDERIELVRTERLAAAQAYDYELADSLRTEQKELLASKIARLEHWAAPDLAERCQQLADEAERLRVLLRQHGIDPQDKPARHKTR